MNQYRKALKNYTTTADPKRVLNQIEQIILDFGGNGILFEYDSNQFVNALTFRISFRGADRFIKIPFNVEKVMGVLDRQKVLPKQKQTWHRGAKTVNEKRFSLAYRVALANVRDWLDAQLAIYSTEMFEFPQIFLPYMAGNNGQTVYDLAMNSNLFLSGPDSHN